MLVLSILPIYMYACAYVCVLHTYRRVKQLTVKIKSNNRAHTTHRHSHSRTHARNLQLTASYAVRLLFSLSLSHLLALQHNEGNWAESLPLAVFCNLPKRGGGGHFNRRRRRRRHNKLQRSATHGRAAQRCLCLLLLWLRCPFAFRIPRPDAANEALSTASCGVRSWHSVRDEISWLMDVCSFPRFHSSTTVHQHQQPSVNKRLNRHLWHFEEDVRRYLRAENEV